jgi:hypothetical protein
MAADFLLFRVPELILVILQWIYAENGFVVLL